MLQKKEYQQKNTTKIPVTPTIKNATKQEIPTKTNVTKEGLTTTTTIKIPTKTNVTKEEIPTTTIKKPIVENQTSGKIKTNVTKEGIPTKQHRQRYQ